MRLHEHGFTSLEEDADHYGLGLVLGGGEVTMLELAQAYMGLANLGRQFPLRMIVADSLDSANPQPYATISAPHLNFLISNILSDPFARAAEYGFDSILNLPFTCSAKTGTSFRFCDNWTMGFTEDYTLGVWVGNFDHSPMMNVSGVTGAGPIFANIMYQLYTRKDKPQDPNTPQEVVRLKLCPLSGKLRSDACPSVFEELIQSSEVMELEKEICEMHLPEIREATQLPPRYLNWASGLGMAAVPDSSADESLFRIVNPQSGAVYQRISYLAGEYQSIRFELNRQCPEEKIHWLLNGEPLEITVDEHEILWQSQPGQYKLTAVAGSDETLSASVSFTVK